MIALIRKDLRLMRLPLVVSACLFVTPVIIAGIAWAFFPDSPVSGPQREGIAGLALVGAYLCTIGASLPSAVAFAGERRDRTAEFVATLPVSRLRIVMSKFIVSLAAAAWPWVLALGLAVPMINWTDQGLTEPVPWALCASVALFGLGWLCSSLLESEVFSMAIAIVCVSILAFGAWVLADGARLTGHETRLLYFTLLPAVGIAGFLGGTVVALRRTSP